MKTLYLVRHAKSSHHVDGLQDWERPLLDVGIERAGEVSNLLKKRKIYPEKIISSHAFRALNTAVIFALNLDYPLNEIEICHDIYEKGILNITNLIQNQNGSISSLMLFGHNPIWMDLYNLLTGEVLDCFSTSTAACIQFDCDNWEQIRRRKGKTLFIETGK